MKVTDITVKSYVKVQEMQGGLCISPIHLDPRCPGLINALNASHTGVRMVVVDPAEVVGCMSHFLLSGLSVCEACGVVRSAKEAVQ